MEFLKNFLGDELYKQVAEKLKGQDKSKFNLVNLAEGGYVSKEKYTALETSENQYKGIITERDKQLEGLKKFEGDNKELQGKIKELEDANKSASEDYQKQLNETRRAFALDSFLKDSKVKNPKAVKALLDSETIIYKDDKFTGLDEQITKLKESDSYLFDTESANPPGSGGAPALGDGKGDGAKENLFDFDFQAVHPEPKKQQQQ